MNKKIYCPKCQDETTSLLHIRSGWVNQECFLNDNEKLDYDNYEFNEDGNISLYNCPLCDAELFTNEEEALKFLRGDK